MHIHKGYSWKVGYPEIKKKHMIIKKLFVAKKPKFIRLKYCKSITICAASIFAIFEVCRKPWKAIPVKNSPQILIYPKLKYSTLKQTKKYNFYQVKLYCIKQIYQYLIIIQNVPSNIT